MFDDYIQDSLSFIKEKYNASYNILDYNEVEISIIIKRKEDSVIIYILDYYEDEIQYHVNHSHRVGFTKKEVIDIKNAIKADLN